MYHHRTLDWRKWNFDFSKSAQRYFILLQCRHSVNRSRAYKKHLDVPVSTFEPVAQMASVVPVNIMHHVLRSTKVVQTSWQWSKNRDVSCTTIKPRDFYTSLSSQLYSSLNWRQTKHRRKGRDMAQSIMHMVFWSTNIYGWEIIRNMYRRAIKETIMHHKFLHKYHQFWFSSFILEAAIVGEWQRGGICFFCCWWQQSAVMLPDTIPAF